MVLRPGQYPSLAAMGMERRGQLRAPVAGNVTDEDNRYARRPGSTYDYRKRDNERLVMPKLPSVRAVYGAGEQRCWVERQDVPANDATSAGPRSAR